MKPAPFTYHRATSVEEALALLGSLGDEAKLLAGGQSLVPMMNFRLARPTALVDISRLRGLAQIVKDDAGIEIGALTTHQQLEHFPAFPPPLTAIARTARTIAHPPIRARGTIGGSLAHADPAAEWCTLMAALDATVVIAGPSGQRQERAEDFLRGFFTTSLGHQEMVLAVRIDSRPTHADFREYARRYGDFAIVMASASYDLDEEGRIRAPRVVIGGIGGRPLRAEGAEQILVGERPTPAVLREAAERAASDVEPTSDALASSVYRRRLVRTLVRQVIDTSSESGREIGRGDE